MKKQTKTRISLVFMIGLLYTTSAAIVDCEENEHTNTTGNNKTCSQTVAVICTAEYNVQGNRNITCLANSTWSQTSCSATDCGSVYPLNGTKRNVFKHKIPEQFLCGNSDCNTDGDRRNTITCNTTECEDHTEVASNQSKSSFIQTASASCSFGYIIGITCFVNANWNTTPDGDTGTLELHLTDILIVAGIVASTIMIICIIIILYLKREKPKQSFAEDFEEPVFEILDMEVKVWSKFRTSPVKIKEFPSYVETLHKKNNQMFDDGFRLLSDESPSHPTTVAETPACKPKTRYSNILPFDHSRVQLQSRGTEGSDFINANYIPGYSSRREYIATQGPLSETKNDFWRMVWEENVEFIVMLTKRLETGKGSLPRNYPYERRWVVQTFDPYWPDEVQGPVYYGELIVRTKSETVLTDYVIRVMETMLGEEKRTVTQFHFLRWPEQGCPRRTWPFINFVNMVRNHKPQFPVGRVVVHCSTGVGRTAMYIAVDRLLQQIREEDEVDVYSVILDMRNYRCNMVKTEEQFIYIHECIRHFITMEEDEGDEEGDERQYAGAGYIESTYENSAFLQE